MVHRAPAAPDHDRFAGHAPTVFHIFTDGSAERNAAG